MPGKLITKSFSSRPSLAEAQREAGIGYGAGALLAKAHVGAAQLVGMQDYSAPMLASVALAAAEGVGLRVLDFGGGSGFFRAYVNDFFGQQIRTEWRVVETPEHVEHILPDVTVPGLQYSTSIGHGRFDIAIFSGSLNYVDDWQSVLRETNADVIFIARTPIDDIGRAYLQTVVSNFPGIVSHFAGHVIEKHALFALLSETHDIFRQLGFPGKHNSNRCTTCARHALAPTFPSSHEILARFEDPCAGV